ncbi:MAG: nickel-dependent lactate racemase [Candidatus Zixiibacteriota bacterium]
MNTIRLDYGRTGVTIDLDPGLADWDIIEPRDLPALENPINDFVESVSHPFESMPLDRIILPNDELVIVTADGTRPVPNKFLIRAIIDFCRLDPAKVTILVGTGTHRPHRRNELVELLGQEIINDCRVVCHNAADQGMLEFLGATSHGIPVHMNEIYTKARKRIVLGFIEPHFFAGFSGGAKGICPAVCGLETIDAFHSFDIIGHPKSDYGILEDNPQQMAAREVTGLAPPDFLINVILNSQKEISRIFAGHYIEAHRLGCQSAAETAIVRIGRKFPIVVTSNAGHPLDQNLYQTVKGIAAASLITEEGGTIIIASECSRGIPDDGNFAEIMESRPDPRSLLAMMSKREFKLMDRWQAQKLVIILEKMKVKIYTSLDAAQVEKCGMIKVNDIRSALADEIAQPGYRPRVAVMPHGPLTIPQLVK